VNGTTSTGTPFTDNINNPTGSTASGVFSFTDTESGVMTNVSCVLKTP
jgi:hypothetical protein